MSILLDLILVLIILITVLISAKRGFVRVIIELVGFIAAVFITFTISTPLSNITYDKIIEPPITASVESVAADKASASANEIFEALPSFIRANAEKIGITKESIDRSITENLQNGAENAAETALTYVVKPVVVKLFSLIYSILILIVLLFLVKILAKFVNKLFSFSIVGKLNRILGGIAGLPKGIIYAVLFCLAVSLIVSFTGNGNFIFNKETTESSVLFSFFSDLLPFTI